MSNPAFDYKFIAQLIAALDAPAGVGVTQDRLGFYTQQDPVPEHIVGDVLFCYLGRDFVPPRLRKLIEVAEAFACEGDKFPLTTFWKQPADKQTKRVSGTSASGTPMMAMTDFVALLIQLERMGLPVDAKPWVDKVFPEQSKRRYVTTSGLSICAYYSARNKFSFERQAVRPDDVPPFSRIWHKGETTITIQANTPDKLVALKVERHQPRQAAA